MNGNDSFRLAEFILDAFLRLLELATQIAIIGVMMMAAFIFVSILYLCFKDVLTGDQEPVKPRRKHALSNIGNESITISHETGDSSLLSESKTPETLHA